MSQPTQFTAPEGHQKWRARNVISFHWRHPSIDVPPGYRNVMLCAIDHANPDTGQCDASQVLMAVECKMARETVNRALQWWANETDFLFIENRGVGKRNAYHGRPFNGRCPRMSPMSPV
jgi:hypothetical protein